MKGILIIAGSFLAIMGLVQAGKLLPYLGELTEYGKGYFCGAIILLIIGVSLIIIGIRIKKNKNQ